MRAVAVLCFLLTGCVIAHHLETPDEPRAVLVRDAGGVRGCKLLGVFEGVGETNEQALAMLQIHVREIGATHVLLMSERPINEKRSFNEQIRNETSMSPLYKNVVAQGKGYRCK